MPTNLDHLYHPGQSSHMFQYRYLRLSNSSYCMAPCSEPNVSELLIPCLRIAQSLKSGHRHRPNKTNLKTDVFYFYLANIIYYTTLKIYDHDWMAVFINTNTWQPNEGLM